MLYPNLTNGSSLETGSLYCGTGNYIRELLAPGCMEMPSSTRCSEWGFSRAGFYASHTGHVETLAHWVMQARQMLMHLWHDVKTHPSCQHACLISKAFESAEAVKATEEPSFPKFTFFFESSNVLISSQCCYLFSLKWHVHLIHFG